MLDSRLARLFPFMALAKQNLSRAKVRSILAMAGITIGVIAIASLGMFGAAYEQSLRNTFDDGASSVFISAGEDANERLMDRQDVQQIKRYTDDPVYPIARSFGRVSGLEGETRTTLLSVRQPTEFVTVAEGELPEQWRSGVLVGATLADQLEVRSGDSVTINGETRRVIGVLEETGRANVLPADNAVFLPPAQSESQQYGYVVVRAENPPAAFATAERLDQNLNGRRQHYEINDFESNIERFNRQINSFNTLLVGIGAVSLLVACVSILNVMLMSTIERKEEIGVLRAVGYHRLDILRLMLGEAALLGLVGAVIGVVLSIVLGMIINDALLSDPFAFTQKALTYTVLGFVFGTAASFLSGLYPAWKAANARPVEALRD